MSGNFFSFQLHSPSSLDMSNKIIPFPKGGKDWAVVRFSIQNQYIIHKNVTKLMYHLPFQRRHELNASKIN